MVLCLHSSQRNPPKHAKFGIAKTTAVMQKALQEKKTFTKIDYSGKKLPPLEFDNCSFVNCIFTQSDLSDSDFVDCRFDECSFSMVKLNNTGLKNVRFNGCKLLGVDFTKCRDFLLSFRFEDCSLDYATFHKKKIRSTLFKNCTIKEADFSGADLTASGFLNCDLTRTLFNKRF